MLGAGHNPGGREVENIKFKQLLYVLMSQSEVKVKIRTDEIATKTVYDWLLKLENKKYHDMKVSEVNAIGVNKIETGII